MNSLLQGLAPPRLMGYRAEVVEAGTEIEHDETGEVETVRDDNTILKDNKVIYCTIKIFDHLKREFGE